jgi:hypothetical protein
MTVVGVLLLAAALAGVPVIARDPHAPGTPFSPRAGRFGATQPKGMNL